MRWPISTILAGLVVSATLTACTQAPHSHDAVPPTAPPASVEGLFATGQFAAATGTGTVAGKARIDGRDRSYWLTVSGYSSNAEGPVDVGLAESSISSQDVCIRDPLFSAGEITVGQIGKYAVPTDPTTRAPDRYRDVVLYLPQSSNVRSCPLRIVAYAPLEWRTGSKNPPRHDDPTEPFQSATDVTNATFRRL